MKKVKVNRSAFVKLPQDELATYVENVIARCKGNDAYPMLVSDMDALQAALNSYNQALVAARNRGTDTTAIKRQAQTELLNLLDRAANMLEYNSTDEAFVISAGFHLPLKRQSHRGSLPPPVLAVQKPTGNSGELLLRISVVSPKQVLSNVFEYSTDGGINWQKGTYQKGTQVLLKDLPPKTDVTVRACSIGTNGRVSAWSAPVTQFVV